jgi:hypothetical protein
MRKKEFKKLICGFKESENAYYQRNRNSTSYLDGASPQPDLVDNNEEQNTLVPRESDK